MARLYILRHGKTEDVSDTGIDFDRNLVHRGEKNARRIGNMIKTHLQKPELLLCSPANRTRQTAEFIKEECPGINDMQDDRIYNADPDTLFDVITDHGFDHKCLMLVGHNPGLILLTHMLMAEDGNRAGHNIMDFPSATFVEMVFEAETFGQIKRDSGVLMKLLRPREMTSG